MTPIWLILFLACHQLSAASSDTEDFKTNPKDKGTEIIQPNEVSQEMFPMLPPKHDYYFQPIIGEDEDIVIIDGDIEADKGEQDARARYKRGLEDVFRTDQERNGLLKFLLDKANCDGVDEKRNVKFHAWGGKRAEDTDTDSADLYEPPGDDKRARFSSWGGKRQDEVPTGPKPFRPWGGKRDKDVLPAWPKYTPFKAWGGKRSDSMNPLKNARVRRPRFHSWGGKRNAPWQEETAERDVLNFEIPIKRYKFNSWGGKRTPEEETDYPIYKKSFHSWGGKRLSTDTEENDN